MWGGRPRPRRTPGPARAYAERPTRAPARSHYGTTAIAKSLVAGRSPASTTRTVKLNRPFLVGVPEMRPLLVSNVRPAGKAPLATLQVYGACPPPGWSV